ncbi:DUF4232 domain-containing protein [Rhodococcus oryzae]|uniref:DUF4232 domain-containing protein n=1 Tax=Rhodococcus oryzae TaxID=2571143 RepID=A0ABY2RGG0_9NOCA|nr:DUF4232 domain-containing protein [Rhodococcus oryzae]TJZ75796.1 DUF4232 domain-containing protein [Rhodococcus oryzae]
MTRTRIVAVLLATSALALAACDSSSTEGDPTAAPAPPTLPTTAAEIPPVDTTAAGPPPPTAAPDDPNTCAATELMLTAGQVEGAAGSTMIPLVFTNIGGRTCLLDGFPGVSYVAEEHGAEVGAPATRSGAGQGPVELTSNGKATAQVRAIQVANYPPELCDPTPVAGLRVFPPNAYASLFLPMPGTGCAKTGPEVTQLEVTAVVAGG